MLDMSIPVISRNQTAHRHTNTYSHTNSSNAISKEPQNIQQNTETPGGINCHSQGFKTKISNKDTPCFEHKNSPAVTLWQSQEPIYLFKTIA